jgi:hypothetical protein
MDDVFVPVDPGTRELFRRLEAYGDLRLTPDGSARARMRAVVMAAAQARAAEANAGTSRRPIAVAAPTASAAPTAPAVSAPSSWRRPVAALLTGGLTLGLLVGTALSARPGGILYDVRMWAETVSLPAAGLARAEAEVARLAARLEEGTAASATGDATAAGAAFEAYAEIVAEADSASAGDRAARAVVEATVARNVDVLTGLLDTAPAAARPAIERALATSTQLLGGTDQAPPGPRDGTGNGNGDSGNGAVGGGTGGGANDEADTDEDPDAAAPPGDTTDKPEQKKPKKPRPDRSDRPGRGNSGEHPGRGDGPKPKDP